MGRKSVFIDVVLKDGTRCRMHPKSLAFMLRQRQVEKFLSSDEWVYIENSSDRNRTRSDEDLGKLFH